ncbi:hypothetical protein ESZ50_02490 [Weissella muntiaci]|uniref:Uncharacterized protein n=1 Tax=Weissella muntiaci TaxID=2508881 RepID=A0A6C2C9K8_9LACO|nr:hypothetical protein [Weissella muntiaci]TYC50557.1 hypothetical protein ESZ50_02490 [Weissella muntiaci]
MIKNLNVLEANDLIQQYDNRVVEEVLPVFRVNVEYYRQKLESILVKNSNSYSKESVLSINRMISNVFVEGGKRAIETLARFGTSYEFSEKNSAISSLGFFSIFEKKTLKANNQTIIMALTDNVMNNLESTSGRYSDYSEFTHYVIGIFNLGVISGYQFYRHVCFSEQIIGLDSLIPTMSIGRVYSTDTVVRDDAYANALSSLENGDSLFSINVVNKTIIKDDFLNQMDNKSQYLMEIINGGPLDEIDLKFLVAQYANLLDTDSEYFEVRKI